VVNMHSPASDINSATLVTPSVFVIESKYPGWGSSIAETRPTPCFGDYYAL
jgi:hypothetical protein